GEALPPDRARAGFDGNASPLHYRPITQLETLLRGMLDKRRLLDLVRYYIVFEDDGGGTLLKKMAGYHQFHAVQCAIEETVQAARLDADPQTRGRIGVVWHTQGSGKSLTMAF